MNKNGKSPRQQCSPPEADWYVEVIYGRDVTAHGTYGGDVIGTETDYAYGYFKGEKPTMAERDALVPEGFKRLESTVERCGGGE